MSYIITRRQSTYWDLASGTSVTRIHFLGKEEFRFVQPRAESFSIVQDHPVLMDYQFAWESIFLGSPDPDPPEILDRMTAQVRLITQGWREVERYFNPLCDTFSLIRDGHGLLLSAPIPVSSAVSAVLTTAGHRFTALPGGGPRWPREVLVAGENFVVARSFRVEHQST